MSCHTNSPGCVLETGEDHRPREGRIGNSKDCDGNPMYGAGALNSAHEGEPVLQSGVLSGNPCQGTQDSSCRELQLNSSLRGCHTPNL